jgi:gas vesicle protein
MIDEHSDNSLIVQRATRMDARREERHMADSYDRYDRFDNESNGGGFMMGLLTGTVLGAGLGMLLAPKAGAELRGAIGEQARTWGSAASEQYRTVREQAGPWVERGRDMVNQAREAVTRGADEARGYTGATTGSEYGSGGSSTPSGTGYGSGGSGTGYGGTGTGSSDFNRS